MCFKSFYKFLMSICYVAGDTHGLVDDDWETIKWGKIQLLQTLIDLKPFYGGPTYPINALPGLMSSGAAIQSAGAGAVPATTPFSRNILGIDLPFESLLLHNDTARGDVAAIAQRMKTLGFSAVKLSYSFSDEELVSSLYRPCTFTDLNTTRAGLVPPGFDINFLVGYALPTAAQLPTSNSTHCNAFLQGASNPLLQVVNVLVESGLFVLVQNTDAALATSQPNAWISSMVQLSSQLGSLNSSQIGIGLLELPGSPLAWNSASSRPGLTDLYITALNSFAEVAPLSPLFLQGAQGNDFTNSDSLFRRVLTHDYKGRVVAYAGSDPYSTADYASDFTFLATTGTCLTQAYCQSLQLVAQVLGTNYSMAATADAQANSWIAFSVDPPAPSWNEIDALVDLGLAPWYLPKSAYDRVPGPNTTNSTGFIKGFVNYPCSANISISNVGDVSLGAAPAVFKISFNNLRDTTVLPPYSLTINSAAIAGSLATFGGRYVVSADGQLNATVADYSDVLWPEAYNSIELLYIMSVSSTNFTDMQLSLSGQQCDVNVIY